MSTTVPITTSTVTVTDNGSTVAVSVASSAVSVDVGTTGPQGAVGPGVPAGGTTGQVLVKSSATDYATGWSSAVPLSSLATGALPTGITVASANLVNGTIVDEDVNASAAIAQSKIANLTTDLSAKAPAVWLNDIRYPMVAGSYYSLGASTVTGSMTEALELAQLFIPARSCTLDRVGIVITTTAGSAGAVIRLGLRSWDSSTGAPSTLVADFGTVDATSTGAKTITISQAVTADTVYMLTATCQGAASTRPTVQVNDKGPYPSAPYSSPSAAVFFWGKSSVTGALDNTGSFTAQWVTQPRIFVRSS